MNWSKSNFLIILAEFLNFLVEISKPNHAFYVFIYELFRLTLHSSIMLPLEKFTIVIISYTRTLTSLATIFACDMWSYYLIKVNVATYLMVSFENYNQVSCSDCDLYFRIGFTRQCNHQYNHSFSYHFYSLLFPLRWFGVVSIGTMIFCSFLAFSAFPTNSTFSTFATLSFSGKHRWT